MFPIEKADEKNGGWSGIDSLGGKGSKRDENERRIESTAFTTLWRVSRKLKGDDQCKPVRNSLSNASRVCSTDTSPSNFPFVLSCMYFPFFFIFPPFPTCSLFYARRLFPIGRFWSRVWSFFHRHREFSYRSKLPVKNGERVMQGGRERERE